MMSATWKFQIILNAKLAKDQQVSISSTLDVRVFRANVISAAFSYENYTHITLMKLTAAAVKNTRQIQNYNLYLHVFFPVSWSLMWSDRGTCKKTHLIVVRGIQYSLTNFFKYYCPDVCMHKQFCDVNHCEKKKNMNFDIRKIMNFVENYSFV